MFTVEISSNCAKIPNSPLEVEADPDSLFSTTKVRIVLIELEQLDMLTVPFFSGKWDHKLFYSQKTFNIYVCDSWLNHNGSDMTSCISGHTVGLKHTLYQRFHQALFINHRTAP